MHEFELGVWKSLLTHLIRIFCAQGGDTVSNFNSRFRLVPTFGNGTVRCFSENTASLTKLAARNYEDILTVSRFYILLHKVNPSLSVKKSVYSLCIRRTHNKREALTGDSRPSLRCGELARLGEVASTYGHVIRPPRRSNRTTGAPTPVLQGYDLRRIRHTGTTERSHRAGSARSGYDSETRRQPTEEGHTKEKGES